MNQFTPDDLRAMEHALQSHAETMLREGRKADLSIGEILATREYRANRDAFNAVWNVRRGLPVSA